MRDWTPYLERLGIEGLAIWIERPWVHAALIVVAALLLAFVFDWLVTALARRLVAKTHTDVDDKIIDLLHGPVRTSVVLAGLWLATEAVELPDPIESLTLRLLKTIAVIVWTLVLVRGSGLVLQVLSRHQERFHFIEESTLTLFENLAKVVVVGGAFYFALLSWDIDISAWLASAGIVGIAIGFAAKDTIANLFAGVFILADKPYSLGDYIVLDSGERGKVTNIGLRTTRLLTRDDVEITIPNAVMGQAKITNESGGPWPKERVRVPVGVAYGSDADQVERVLLEVAVGHSEVGTDPAPRVRLRAFGDSSLDYELLGWIDHPELRGRVLHELMTAVYKAFAREGIEIPFPQRDLHIRSGGGGGESESADEG